MRSKVRRANAVESLRYWQAHHQPLRQRALSGSALMVHRRALNADACLFDPLFFMYFEDSDLCMRLRRQGWGMALAPEALAVHAWRNEPHKQGLMEAGAAVYFGKHYPNDRWLRRTQSLQVQPAQPMGDLAQPGARTAEGMELAVPAALQSGWVLELSPDPLLQICVGRLGMGGRALASNLTLAHFGSGPVFARLRSSQQHGGDPTEILALVPPAAAAPLEAEGTV